MLTPNNIDDIFTKQLGRTATPFEATKYGTASLQDLNNLKNTYKGYDQNSPIGKALYTGQDPASVGQPPLNPSGTAQNGTVGHSIGPDPSLSAYAGKDLSGTPQPQPAPASTPGSISAAANTGSQFPTYEAPAPDPGVASSLTAYQGVQKQIADIDAALASHLEQKKQQVQASGGIVNDAQLRGEVQAENAPLVLQRTQLASQQSTLGKQYQSMLAADKANRDSSFKEWQSQSKAAEDKQKASQFNTTTGLNQQKIADTEQNNQTNQTLKAGQLDINAFKAQQGQWKVIKQAVYDDNATKVGEKLVAVNATTGEERPLTSAQAAAAGMSVPAATGNSTSAPVNSSGPSSFKFSDFYTNSEASTPTTGKIIDPKTGISADGLYNAALEYIATNKMPSIGNGTKPKPMAIRSAIINKAGAMLSAAGISQPDYQNLYKASGKAISGVTDRLARIETVNTTLSTEFPRLQELASQVDTKSFTESDLSATKAHIEAKFGNTPAAQYIELIQSMRAEYGAMIAAIGGGRGGAYAFQSASEAIPLGYTAEQYAGVQQNLEFISQKNAESAKGEIKSLMGSTPQLGTKPDASTSTSSSTYDDYLKLLQ